MDLSQHSKQVIHFIIQEVPQRLYTMEFTDLTAYLNCPEEAGLIECLVIDPVTEPDERQHPARLGTVL